MDANRWAQKEKGPDVLSLLLFGSVPRAGLEPALALLRTGF